jgi:Ser/Thr protein kinase RdoA (MazF antagonist)
VEAGIRRLYSPAIKQEAFARYRMEPGGVRELPGFESFIYEFTDSDSHARRILRGGHSSRRSVDAVRAELDWIAHLADGGAAVASGVPSSGGHLVEVVPDGDGGEFVAAAFVYAEGVGPRTEDTLIDIAEAYGRAVGRMHALTKSYSPSEATWTREHWDHPTMLNAREWLPETESVAAARLEEVIASCRALPRDGDSYGLVHQDAHGGNFHIGADGRLTFFDFDDCGYTWFANDIAIVMFYAALFKDDPPAFLARFMPVFLKGYASENSLDPAWLTEMPLFLKLREVGLYAVIHRSFDVENLTNTWVVAYMNGRRDRIEEGAPFVEFDFTSLADGLARA